MAGEENLLIQAANLITEPLFVGGLFISGIILHKFFHRKDKLFVLALFLTLIIAVSGGLSFALKEQFSVERPCAGKAIDCPLDYSFPSSHATISFAVFSFLFFLNGRWVASDLILAFPFAISLSRVTQGVHTIADVSFGAAIGTFLGFLFSQFHVFSHKFCEKAYLREKGISRNPKSGKFHHKK